MHRIVSEGSVLSVTIQYLYISSYVLGVLFELYRLSHGCAKTMMAVRSIRIVSTGPMRLLAHLPAPQTIRTDAMFP